MANRIAMGTIMQLVHDDEILGGKMVFTVLEIQESERKSKYAESILRNLPDWFGNEKSLCDYIERVSKLQFWAAISEKGDCIGFISIKVHYEHTGEIYVCGVLPNHHKQGVGKELYRLAEDYLVMYGCKYIIVKTLSELAQYEPYDKTRGFYLRIGFEPLITLTEMWDDENPCLVMIKELRRST